MPDNKNREPVRPQTPRRPYAPPAIVEEEVFERQALVASCNEEETCAPFKAPS